VIRQQGRGAETRKPKASVRRCGWSGGRRRSWRRCRSTRPRAQQAVCGDAHSLDHFARNRKFRSSSLQAASHVRTGLPPNAAELTAGSGEKAKPNAASRTASLSVHLPQRAGYLGEVFDDHTRHAASNVASGSGMRSTSPSWISNCWGVRSALETGSSSGPSDTGGTLLSAVLLHPEQENSRWRRKWISPGLRRPRETPPNK